MSHKKTAEHQPTDTELHKEFAESMDAAIEEKENEPSGKFTSTNIPSGLSDEEFWKVKLSN